MSKCSAKGTLVALLVSALVSGCSAFKHADDDKYTICKNLQGQISFGGRTNALTTFGGGVTGYAPAQQQSLVDRQRLQDTYDKLDCAKYQWLRL